MAENFRQEVEKILDGLCLQCLFEEAISVEFRNIATDHICAAAERMAERMPKPDPSRFINEAFRDGFDVGADWTLRDNQAHIRKECQ